MKLTWETNEDGMRVGLVVERANSPKIYSESAFWYAVKKALATQFGLVFVKKRPDKDGHLTDAPYYLRAPKSEMAIFDPLYAVRRPQDEYNEANQSFRLVLRVVN